MRFHYRKVRLYVGWCGLESKGQILPQERLSSDLGAVNRREAQGNVLTVSMSLIPGDDDTTEDVHSEVLN